MGAILTKWKRAASSKETLENLQKELERLSQQKQNSQQCERTLVALLLIVFLLGYPLVCGLGYLFLIYWGATVGEKLLFAFGLLLYPIICYAGKRLLSRYCVHRKAQYESAIQNLKTARKKVLDEVMDKEPYRVAKELLEKYDPSHTALQPTTPQPQQQVRRRQVAATATPHPRAPSTPHPALMHQNRAVQQPTLSDTPRSRPPPSAPPPPPPTPSQTPAAQPAHSQQTDMQTYIPPGYALGPAPGPPAPIPILPRSRSTVDKLTDFLVGDGPGSRYALICTQCYSHNGMALKDEFEYTAFRCAYCYHLNPARQTKPSVSSPAVTFLPSPSSSFLQEDESHKPDEEEKPNSVKDGKDETELSIQAQPLTASVRES